MRRRSTDSGRHSEVQVLMNARSTKTNAVTMGAITATLGVVAFAKLVRPWYLRWGATDTEVARPMPLDEHVSDPMLNSTMAITIEATPEEVWPWLAQMGDPPRAGYYSYTWIERLVGLRIENVDAILPQFQSLRVGEALDKGGTMRVLALEPGHHLVLGPPDSVDTVQCTWAFGLYPTAQQATRLVSRCRARWSYRRMLEEMPLYALLPWLLIEPGAFIMERKMLLEIKERAERPRMPRITPSSLNPSQRLKTA
jgi:hypothetical protein